MKWILVFQVMLTLGFFHSAAAGEVGNGGDPIRLLFEEAREYAAERVRSAQPCAFGVNTNPSVVSWVMVHREQLAQDIELSPHVWITDPQSTCAFTQTHAKAAITFSFEACRPGVKGINDAVSMLIHESVHHFEITDEVFADQVAKAISSLGMDSSCHPIHSEDPFNPASCSGNTLSESDLLNMIPLPQKNYVDLGNFNVFTRLRMCYGEGWCTNWGLKPMAYGISERSFWSYHPQDNTPIALDRSGTLELQYSGNRPRLFLKSGGDFSTSWQAVSAVANYDLNMTWTDRMQMMIGNTRIKPMSSQEYNTTFKGSITKTCMRQVAAGKYKSKDDKGNDVVYEYEAVVLSLFK